MLRTALAALCLSQLCAWADVRHDVGSRLLLTPYIQLNMLQKARSLAAVNGGPFRDGIPSYSGYLTVNKKFNSNLFFWFFPAERDYENAPVILWLQGGPGTSSMFGLFEELGPFSVAEDNVTLVENPYSWHKNHSLIFIDNPVGTGFSFTDFSAGYATNQTQIGEELYIALIQFFTLFSELRSLPFFIAGESYAGKYVPSLGYTIHKKNPTAQLKINLEGIAVGNGWTDPINMLDVSSFLYQLGLVDNNARQTMRELEEQAARLIEKGNYEEANIMRGFAHHHFLLSTDIENPYNFIDDKALDTDFRHRSFLKRPEVRRALHVGDANTPEFNVEVYKKLVGDIMKSVRPWLEELIEWCRVLYYSGQLDVVVPYPLSVNMYHQLNFSAAEEYRNATRVPWYVDGELAGYVKSAGNFTEVLVRNAGHMAPADQPKWMFELIYNFTRNEFKQEEHHFKNRKHRPWRLNPYH